MKVLNDNIPIPLTSDQRGDLVTMSPLSDNLILFLKTSKQEYFELFYHTLFPLAYKVSVLITKNTADAEDVAQTAFYTVFHQLETCRSLHEKNDEKLRSWFLSIVYNQSKLVVRSRVRSQNKEKNKNRNIQNNSSENPMSPHLEAQIKSAIDSLDEKYRTPIILKYNEGLSTIEIATILEMKEATLRVRLRRGLDQLRNLLSKEEKEFEKMLPSISLLLIDQYSHVPPTPAFINQDVINSKSLLAQENYFKIKVASLVFSILVATSFLTYQLLPKANHTESASVQLKKPDQVLQPQEKISWDFSKGNMHDFKILYGNWDYKTDGMVATEMKEPNATFVALPIKPGRNFKINITGKIEFVKEEQIVPYVVKGVLLKGNDLITRREVTTNFIQNHLLPSMLKKDAKLPYYPMKVTLYFTEQYIGTCYMDNEVQSISELYNVAPEVCGFLIRDIKVQNIEYEPVTPKEALAINQKIEGVIKRK